MKGATSRLLVEDALTALKSQLTVPLQGQSELATAFIGWVLNDREGNYVDWASLTQSAAGRQGAARAYHDVAILGFAVSLAADRDSLMNPLTSGLEWMLARKPFLQSRLPDFEVDGLALLGMAQGTVCCEEGPVRQKLCEWLASILNKSLREMRLDGWEQSYMRAALWLTLPSISLQPSAPAPDMVPEFAVALAGKGLWELAEQVEHQALLGILTSSTEGREVIQAAVQLAALHKLLRQAPTALPGRAQLSDAAELLHSIIRSLRRWCWETKPRKRNAEPIKWDIQSEYQVQDLLWVILAPIFPDLEDEENLPSLGHKHPRADLGIPSLHTIVEVKMVYKGERAEFAEIIEQVAADTALYLSEKSGYQQVIAFVWDNSSHTEEHPELLQGLRKIRGVFDAVVIPRPGAWNTQGS